jgi:uncharacterized membrane protein
MMRVWICLFLWVVGFGLARAETLPALYDVTGVAADDVLNLRAAPDAMAEIQGALASSDKDVEVVALSPDGLWGRVNQGEVSAWVSMNFLQRVGEPDWDVAQTPMTCFGTEPFWSMAVSSQGDMVFKNIESAEIELWRDWSSAVAGRQGMVGLAVSGRARHGFLTMTGQECSDGMSDRVFGISMSLFWHGEGGTKGYSGCCSLAP